MKRWWPNASQGRRSMTRKKSRPSSNSWTPALNPLFELENCIITPHVAYVSDEALKECRRVAAENARAVLLGDNPPNPVTPQLEMLVS